MLTCSRMPALRHPKMVEAEALKRLLAPLRVQGRRIVFTNGCFDILHPGHVDLLAEARTMGDLLIVGLNSDSSVRRQGKGAGRPFNAYDARAFVLAHLASVDFVVPFAEDTPLDLIRLLRPHVLVKGGDYSADGVVGRDIVEGNGGELRIVPLLPGWSTTDLARRIQIACPEALP